MKDLYLEQSQTWKVKRMMRIQGANTPKKPQLRLLRNTPKKRFNLIKAIQTTLAWVICITTWIIGIMLCILMTGVILKTFQSPETKWIGGIMITIISIYAFWRLSGWAFRFIRDEEEID